MHWIIILLFYTAPCFAIIVNHFSEFPKQHYDYIIIGAGTAGSVLARRLTDDSNTNVLVIEAGGQNVNSPFIQIPGNVGSASPNTIYDWNDTSIPQPQLIDRNLQVARGHVIGGSSSINFMAYVRPSEDDWNAFAEVTGDQAWSWKSMIPYMDKVEKHVQSADDHDTSGEFNPQYHGFHGPVLTSLPGFPTEIDNRILETTKELSEDFPFNLDINSGKPLGIGWLHSTIGNSSRSNAATSYLLPVIQRSNLHILTNVQATRLMPSQATKLSSSWAVEFAENDNISTVEAQKEVILCAGAIGTPQLLMLSGIGNPDTLKKINVSTLIPLNDVGQNLRDHSLIPFQWSVNSNSTLDGLSQDEEIAQAALQEYQVNGTGPLVSSTSNQIGFLRIHNNTLMDTSNGPNSPHILLSFSNGFVSTTDPVPKSGHFFTGFVSTVAPLSRGSVSLASNSPFSKPVIHPNLLNENNDMQMAIAGYQMLRKFISASAWNNYIEHLFGDSADITDNQSVQQYIQKYAAVLHHYQGTAAASKAQDSNKGVVNPDLKVKNTNGLRIVDASVFPITFSCHTQAAVYAVAERAADIILQIG